LISKGLWQVVITLVASPLLGFVGGYILLIVVYWFAFKMHPNTVRFTFSYVQVLSSAFMSFTHGMNDAQKVMGIITLALYTAGKISDIVVPVWVMFICAFAIAMGTATGGWNVIKTMGMRLSHIRPIEGFAVETSAASVLLLTASLGLPASTTHTITGSILGVGSSRRVRSVKWGIGKKILYAWIFTFPITAILGGIFVIIIRFILYNW
jgi:PiT family inorganic phosphate transporter